MDFSQFQKPQRYIGNEWNVIKKDHHGKISICLVYPENYGAFCAAVRRAEPYLEIADAEGFPNTLCGYARNCIGYAKSLADNNMAVPDGAAGGGLLRNVAW